MKLKTTQYYEILGLKQESKGPQIRKAFHKVGMCFYSIRAIYLLSSLTAQFLFSSSHSFSTPTKMVSQAQRRLSKVRIFLRTKSGTKMDLPNVMGGPSTVVLGAFEVLSDPEKRAALHPPPPANASA
jgi:hypothetical protein